MFLCLFVFFLFDSGTRAWTQPSLPDSIKMCCVSVTFDLSSLKQQSLWHVFSGGVGGVCGGVADIGVSQMLNGCFPLGVRPPLSPAFVHKGKKKKDFKLKFSI